MTSPAISASHSSIVRTLCAELEADVPQHRRRSARSTAAPARVERLAAAGSARRRRNAGRAGRGRSRRRRPARAPAGAPTLGPDAARARGRRAARARAAAAACRARAQNASRSAARPASQLVAPARARCRRRHRRRRAVASVGGCHRARRLAGVSRAAAAARRPTRSALRSRRSVTSTVCSHCADSEWSAVTIVQPSARQRMPARPALIIGSIGEDHAGLQLEPGAGPAVVQHLRLLVELAADAVAAELAHDREAVAFGEALDRVRRCRPGARPAARRGCRATSPRR